MLSHYDDSMGWDIWVDDMVDGRDSGAMYEGNPTLLPYSAAPQT